MERQVRYSVVVASFNGARVIGRCLAALAEQTVAAESYEVIIVDDGSRDATARIASSFVERFRNFRLVRLGENRGLAAARNVGIRAASGEIVLFTDDDAIPPPDWVERIAAHYAEGVAGVGGLPEPEKPTPYARYEMAAGMLKYGPDWRGVDGAGGLNASFRRDALLDIGGFDERFRAIADDADINRRLTAAGYRLRFVPGIVVKHRFPVRFSQFLRRAYRRGGGGRLFERKYGCDRGALAPIFLAWNLVALCSHGRAGAKMARLAGTTQDEFLFSFLSWLESILYSLGYLAGYLG